MQQDKNVALKLVALWYRISLLFLTKTSQNEMKTGLSDEIKSLYDKLTQDVKEGQNKLTQEIKEELQGTSAAPDAMKEVLQKGFLPWKLE